MKRTATYGDLFAFLRNHERMLRSTDPFFLVKRFLNRVGNEAEPIISILEGFGAYDDVEVLLNAAERIGPGTPLTAAVETPFQYAVRNELYVYQEGSQWGEPDINMAMEQMTKGNRG